MKKELWCGRRQKKNPKKNLLSMKRHRIVFWKGERRQISKVKWHGEMDRFSAAEEKLMHKR